MRCVLVARIESATVKGGGEEEEDDEAVDDKLGVLSTIRYPMLKCES